MPTLEQVATVSVSKETTQYKPSIRRLVLQWMQDHPEECRRTTFRKLANTMLFPNTGITTKSIETALTGMSYQNMIGYNRVGNSRKKNVYINYLHPSVPNDLVESAPDGQVEKAKKIVENNEIKKKAQEIINQEKPVTTSVEVPISSEILKSGFSLTLNINFNIQQEK